MPLLKLHICTDSAGPDLAAMADELRLALNDVLEVDEQFGKVIIYDSPPSRRSLHPERGMDLVFGEIHIFSGRAPQMKRALFARLTDIIHSGLGVPPGDIFLQILESPGHDWSRAGRSLDGPKG